MVKPEQKEQQCSEAERYSPCGFAGGRGGKAVEYVCAKNKRLVQYIPAVVAQETAYIDTEAAQQAGNTRNKPCPPRTRPGCNNAVHVFHGGQAKQQPRCREGDKQQHIIPYGYVGFFLEVNKVGNNIGCVGQKHQPAEKSGVKVQPAVYERYIVLQQCCEAQWSIGKEQVPGQKEIEDRIGELCPYQQQANAE